MAEYQLQAEPRVQKGKSYRLQLMNEGKIPGVVYGKDIESTPVELEWRNLHEVMSKGGRNAIINMKVKDQGEHKVMVKELQHDPIKRFMRHVDFQKISMHDTMKVSMPVHINGEVKNGVMQVMLYEVEISALPGDIPEYVEVDVSGLTPGDSIKVGDLDLPEKVNLETDPEETLLSVTETRAQVEEQPEGEEEPAGEEEQAKEEAEE